MNLDHISHSQISMWQRCPKQWEYRYVKGLKLPPSGALLEGGVYHETLEFNFRQKINTKRDLPLNDCMELFADLWDKRLQGEPEVEWEGVRPAHLKDEGVSLIGEYRRTVSPHVMPLRVEDTIHTELAGTPFVLRFDLEDIDNVIIDHKTSSRSYTQEDVDKDIQASATAFGLGKPIEYHNHIAVKRATPIIQVVKTYRSLEDIEWWVLMAAKIVMQMKSGLAPPRPTGWHCSLKWCGYYETCRGGLMRRKV